MNINLNFINKDKENNKISSIDEILLSKNNPRFTVINNLNVNLAKFIIENVSSDQEKQEIIYHELLKNEGDLSDLVRLAKNIFQFGFINKNEEILLVYNPNLKKYIVAEGNRRIMLLKIITDKFCFPKIDFFSPALYDNNNTNYITDYENDDDDENDQKIKDNYNEFIKILEQIKKTNYNWTIYYKVIDTEQGDELWSLIFDKHITGKRPGMREWSRAKYFADILTFFPNGIEKNENDLDKFKKINREKDVVIKDFKEAQYVYACFYYYLNKDHNFIDFNNREVINELKKATRISALEKNHSYNKIRNLYIDKFLNGDKKLFDDEYFSIKYNPNNYRIEFKEGKLSQTKFLYNIYNWWSNRLITTRPFKEKNIPIIIDDLNILVNNLNVNNILSKNELWEIDEFSISHKKLDNIIYVNEKVYEKEPLVLMRFKIAKILKILNDQIYDKVKSFNSTWREYEGTPIYALRIFTNQMKFNAPEKYYNAVFVSIRSFFEFLILFISYFVTDNNEEKDKIIDCISEGKDIAWKRSNLYKTMYKKSDDIPYIFNRNKFSEILFGNSFKEEKEIEKLNKYLWDENEWNYLNSPIHAFHKLYVLDNYTKIIEKFSEYEKLLLFILDHGKWENFNDLNNKIKQKILSINKCVSE